jgi:hypothetical protein
VSNYVKTKFLALCDTMPTHNCNPKINNDENVIQSYEGDETFNINSLTSGSNPESLNSSTNLKD